MLRAAPKPAEPARVVYLKKAPNSKQRVSDTPKDRFSCFFLYINGFLIVPFTLYYSTTPQVFGGDVFFIRYLDTPSPTAGLAFCLFGLSDLSLLGRLRSSCPNPTNMPACAPALSELSGLSLSHSPGTISRRHVLRLATLSPCLVGDQNLAWLYNPKTWVLSHFGDSL